MKRNNAYLTTSISQRGLTDTRLCGQWLSVGADVEKHPTRAREFYQSVSHSPYRVTDKVTDRNERQNGRDCLSLLSRDTGLKE